MTLDVHAKMLLHAWSYDFYDAILSDKKISDAADKKE